ncbi:MAG: LytTR family DNA-binding domain-containing protein [Oscillospiraceae bacterium]|nr:LytTR family DNA-binding domain-containing protein [Oscillospiraceae bacterium]
MLIDIAIVDDNEHFCFQLEEMLLEYEKTSIYKFNIEVFNSGQKLIEFTKQPEYKTNLLFLDIEMPGINGVEVGRQLSEILKNNFIQIDYVTHNDSYVKELFEIRPMGFVDKPITKEKIYKQLNIYIDVYCRKPQYFEYGSKKSTEKIEIKEILYIESQSHSNVIFLCNGEEISYSGNLCDVLSSDCGNCFIQIHKSLVVNKIHIKAYKKDNVILSDNKEILISKHYKKAVNEYILNVDNNF